MEYTQMGTAELRALLQEDAAKPADEGMSYRELVPILEVLASRGKHTGERTEKAWIDFVQYYLPRTNE